MDLNEYQRRARRFDSTPSNVTCHGLGLAGEAGEAVDHLKKLHRDGHALGMDFLLELGDVLWYIAALANDLGVTLNDLANLNLAKLSKRERERQEL